MTHLTTTIGLIFQETSRASTALESIKHPDLSKFLVIAAILFIIGVAGVLTRRNLLVIFMSIELILNAANLNFIAFSLSRKANRRHRGRNGCAFIPHQPGCGLFIWLQRQRAMAESLHQHANGFYLDSRRRSQAVAGDGTAEHS